jgi:hypothetical protein
MIKAVAHRTIILSLIMGLLWPWAAASTCHAATPAKAVQGCCAERCCCEAQAPCDCEMDDAPAAPRDEAPATVDFSRLSVELAPHSAPQLTFAVHATRTIKPVRPAHAAITSPREGRAILLRACCLRH